MADRSVRFGHDLNRQVNIASAYLGITASDLIRESTEASIVRLSRKHAALRELLKLDPEDERRAYIARARRAQVSQDG